jgi:hypothetical protein
MEAALDQAHKATGLLKLQVIMEHPRVETAPEMPVDSPQARMARVVQLMEPLLVTQALQEVVQGAQVSKEVLHPVVMRLQARHRATLGMLVKKAENQLLEEPQVPLLRHPLALEMVVKMEMALQARAVPFKALLPAPKDKRVQAQAQVQRLAIPVTPRVVLLATALLVTVPLVPMVIRLHQVTIPVAMLVPVRVTVDQQMESLRVEVRKVKAQGQILQALELVQHQETVLDQTEVMALVLAPTLVLDQLQTLALAMDLLLMVPQEATPAMAQTVVMDLEQIPVQCQAQILVMD